MESRGERRRLGPEVERAEVFRLPVDGALRSRRAGAELIAEPLRTSNAAALDPANAVRDLMERSPEVISPEVPLASVEALFAARGLEAVAVVEPGGELLGLLTLTELLWVRKRPDLASAAAWEALRPRVLVARPEWPIAQAAAVMARHDLPLLPVVGANSTRLEGCLGRQEILSWMARRCGYVVEARNKRATSA